MTTENPTPATALDVKKYFGFTGDGAAKAFAEEWKQLTDEDKAEMKAGVAREIAAGRFDPTTV